MGYKNSDPCIKKAYDDERLFVLMARDQAAAYVVIEWIKHSLATQPAEKLHEALDAAIEMYTTQSHFRNKKFQEEMNEKFSNK